MKMWLVGSRAPRKDELGAGTWTGGLVVAPTSGNRFSLSNVPTTSSFDQDAPRNEFIDAPTPGYYPCSSKVFAASV